MRYENKDIINDLRKNLSHANKELLDIRNEYEEFEQQNIILRAQVADLFKKNDDLVRVVSELSRYYYHIKVGAEKVKELSDYLAVPDSHIAKKIQQYAPDLSFDEYEDDMIEKGVEKRDFF